MRKTSGVPLHRQLFVVLRDQILRGVYERGALIPKEDDLIVEFEVSRNTVRRAVTDLEVLGLVEKFPGKGTFVSQQLPALRRSATLGFLDIVGQTAVTTKVEVLDLSVETPPRQVARQLDLLGEVKAVRALRVRRVGKTPVLLTESWIRESNASGITKATLRKKPLYELLMDQGIVFGRVVQEVSSVLATPFAAKLLETEVGIPMTKLTRLLYDKNRRPIQHLTVHFSPERSRLLMDVSFGVVDTLEAGHIFHDVARPAIAYEEESD